MQFHRLCLVVAVAFFLFLICQILLEVYLENDSIRSFSSYTSHNDTLLFKEVTEPVILWWAPLGGMPSTGTLRQCGQLSCYFTSNRLFRHHPLTKAFMFYGSTIDFMDLPLPRNGSTMLWALLHEESPRNTAPLSHLAAIALFNYTATFSRFSSFPLTTQYLGNLQALTDLKYFVTTEEKNRLQKEEGLAPVMYLQTDCSTTNNRDSYVAELAKYIQVDSYGACLHNKDLPLHLQAPHNIDTMMADDLLQLVAKYKFVLAIENGVCHDYITEKLWRPLICGTVPIYIGSPTVSDWLPTNKSAVLGLDFESPKDLAEHLHQLNNNDDEYDSHLSHKLTSKVTNSLLVQTMEARQWDLDWNSDKEDYVDAFGCYVCKQAHDPDYISVATREHYSCPMPESVLSRQFNSSNFWLDSWFYGACEARVIRQFVDSRSERFTQQEYEEALMKLVLKKKCQYTEENVKGMINEIW